MIGGDNRGWVLLSCSRRAAILARMATLSLGAVIFVPMRDAEGASDVVCADPWANTTTLPAGHQDGGVMGGTVSTSIDPSAHLRSNRIVAPVLRRPARPNTHSALRIPRTSPAFGLRGAPAVSLP